MQEFSSFAIPVEQFFLEGLYLPADVQRDYRWGEAEVDRLLSDLIQAAGLGEAIPGAEAAGEGGDSGAADDPAERGEEIVPQLVGEDPQQAPIYVLGPVVFAHHGGARWHIYDGLQRLTSLTLLMQVIGERLTGTAGAAGMVARLHLCVHTPRGEVRLTAPEWGDWILLEHQVEDEAAGVLPDTKQALRGAAERMRMRLANVPAFRLMELSDYLLTRVYFAVMHIADRGVARQVFVTMNDRGRPLDAAEIFKGQLADVVGTGPEGEEILRRWGAMRASTPDLTGFVRALAVIDGSAHSGSEGVLTLADGLRKYVLGPGNVMNGQRAQNWIWLTEWRATAWAAIQAVRPEADPEPWQKAICALNLMEKQDEGWDWRPLAVELVRVCMMREDRNRKGDHRQVLTDMLWGLWRRMMALRMADASPDFVTAGVRATISAVNRQFVSGGQRVRYRTTFPLPPALGGRIDGIFDTGTQFGIIHRTILKFLETVRAGPDGSIAHLFPERDGDEDATLSPEHILPRRMRRGSDWEKAFPNAVERDRLVNRPGNFILLPHRINKALDQQKFEVKRQLLAEAPGAQPFALVQDILAIEDWTPEVIRARSDAMKEEVRAALEAELEDAATYRNTPYRTRAHRAEA